MQGIIDSNKLKTINVYGNCESLYYPKDEDEYVGINIIKSSFLRIDLKNDKVNKLTFKTRPDGILYPMEDIDKIRTLLKGFKWLDKHRPHNKDEIFIWKDFIPDDDKKKKIRIGGDTNIQ